MKKEIKLKYPTPQDEKYVRKVGGKYKCKNCGIVHKKLNDAIYCC